MGAGAEVTITGPWRGGEQRHGKQDRRQAANARQQEERRRMTASTQPVTANAIVMRSSVMRAKRHVKQDVMEAQKELPHCVRPEGR